MVSGVPLRSTVPGLNGWSKLVRLLLLFGATCFPAGHIESRGRPLATLRTVFAARAQASR